MVRSLGLVLLVLASMLAWPNATYAVTDANCTFDTSGMVRYLNEPTIEAYGLVTECSAAPAGATERWATVYIEVCNPHQATCQDTGLNNWDFFQITKADLPLTAFTTDVPVVTTTEGCEETDNQHDRKYRASMTARYRDASGAIVATQSNANSTNYVERYTIKGCDVNYP